MPSTMYTTPIAMKSSRPRLVSDAWNTFAEPWKLVVTVAGSTCRATWLT